MYPRLIKVLLKVTHLCFSGKYRNIQINFHSPFMVFVLFLKPQNITVNILLKVLEHGLSPVIFPSSYVSVFSSGRVILPEELFLILLLIYVFQQYICDVYLEMSVFYFILFYWSIVDLQCCVSFRCTAK